MARQLRALTAFLEGPSFNSQHHMEAHKPSETSVPRVSDALFCLLQVLHECDVHTGNHPYTENKNESEKRKRKEKGVNHIVSHTFTGQTGTES